MDRCDDCGNELCRSCGTHVCLDQCDCGRSHTCVCECRAWDEYLTNAS
ncbi:hypothetical protein GCM10027160_29310 [Streptomyces calidiresistens]|uniref:Uncharacterized protein n=1 Tax=Streptomyces calidiresistens TaxID=1485586 RepID=A0A7W3T778_9ACTN|nr:hypothetical protein [Streptomyces calidiresistens]MBB0232215.1 hypothetical protein [Streptomyces calidiresistens]